MNALMRAGHSMSGGERNCAYLNTGAMKPSGKSMPRFVNFSAPAGLDLPDESRSVIMTDWDGDGDLDVWYSNRNAPRLRMMRNDLESGGRALTAEETGVLDVFQRSFFSLRLPLPVPSAFLVDRHGRLAVIYRGPAEVSQIVKDGKLLEAPPEQWLAAAVPLGGHWESAGVVADPAGAARAFLREGFVPEGTRYLEGFLEDVRGEAPPGSPWPAPPRLAAAAGLLADFQRLRGDRPGVDAAYRRALSFDPGDLAALQHLGNVLARSGRLTEAIPYFEKAAAVAPDDVRILNDLGVARALQNQADAATEIFRRITALRPGFAPAHTNLGRLALQSGNPTEARQHLETAWRLAPGNRETARLLVSLYGGKNGNRPAEAVAVA
ncbi:MAG: tetratricopeptide repeat protein, partial [Verrucomicrobiota bacterium]